MLDPWRVGLELGPPTLADATTKTKSTQPKVPRHNGSDPTPSGEVYKPFPSDLLKESMPVGVGRGMQSGHMRYDAASGGQRQLMFQRSEKHPTKNPSNKKLRASRCGVILATPTPN